MIDFSAKGRRAIALKSATKNISAAWQPRHGASRPAVTAKPSRSWSRCSRRPTRTTRPWRRWTRLEQRLCGWVPVVSGV